MTSEREELIAWATRNKKDGLGNWRTPDEIATFALMNQFDPMLVHKIFVDWQVGFGLDTVMRYGYGVDKEIAYLERQSMTHDSWKCLGEYLMTGKEWA